ncbi:DUF2238 domain-containing protein [Aliikangiella sp. G2MR2-5]|uniref:DUF2238 domain-containing protein n=1 Tax=Aliikangiella sp. G2MR2-5 TaxID=2788943 RepID=UPI0018AAF902|nr:DUF2238 domain-containing protein [Aliikangiella sp. G2MR2-5]
MSFRYPTILLSILFVWFMLLAIKPYNRHDWALENILTTLFILSLVLSYKKFPFSKISYTCIFVFLFLHVLGAHFTYARVPYDMWSQNIFEFSINEWLGWERNNFDRLVHFCYGLFLAYPIRELFIRIVNVRGFWGYFLPLDLTMSTSLVYELLEWGVVEVVASDIGQAYLGTQGDIWDAHKDMLLAALGALIAMMITAIINWHYQKDFAKEWNDSLKIKMNSPLT